MLGIWERQPQKSTMLAIARRLFLATRPMFFPASVLPVLVGTAWGGPPWDGEILLLALLGMICLHAGANVLNDVGDELNGCDRLNEDRIGPFTGGSRMIQDGILSLPQMTFWGVALLAAAGVAGLMLMVAKGWVVLALGLVGGFLGVAYSIQPFALASRGWGELAVAVGFGLPVVASGWLQSGTVGWELAMASLAVGAWSAAILIVNEIPDMTADANSGKRTLVVRLGRHRTCWLYGGVQSVGAAALMALAATGWELIPPVLLFAVAVMIVGRLMGERQDLIAAIRATLTIQLLGGIWLMVLAQLPNPLP